MARKPRIQYPGAIYHILSRRNYRTDLFTMAQSGIEFEKALFEACASCGWRLHAYVIMSNHYHLALETPKGNLVEGFFERMRPKTGEGVSSNSNLEWMFIR